MILCPKKRLGLPKQMLNDLKAQKKGLFFFSSMGFRKHKLLIQERPECTSLVRKEPQSISQSHQSERKAKMGHTSKISQ